MEDSSLLSLGALTKYGDSVNPRLFGRVSHLSSSEIQSDNFKTFDQIVKQDLHTQLLSYREIQCPPI